MIGGLGFWTASNPIVFGI